MFIEHLDLKTHTVIDASNKLVSLSLLLRSIKISHCDFVLMFLNKYPRRNQVLHRD